MAGHKKPAPRSGRPEAATNTRVRKEAPDVAAVLIDPEHKMDDPEFRKQFAAAVLIHTARIMMKREGLELTSVKVRWREPPDGPDERTQGSA